MSERPNDQNPATSPSSRGERRLALAGIAVLAGLLVASLALWVRHGEEIFFSRIVSAIENCF